MGIKLLKILKEEVSEQYWGLAWQDLMPDESKRAAEYLDKKKITYNSLSKIDVNSEFLISPSSKRNSPFNQVRGYDKDGSPKLHKGIDYGVGVGTLVVLLKPGKVTRAGMNINPRGWGALIEIQHDDGSMTRYGHMSEIYVNGGAEVKSGDIIGATGGAKGSPGAGNSKGPHLHFEYLINGTATDPSSSNNDVNTYRFLNKSDKDKFENEKNNPVKNDVNNNSPNQLTEKQMDLIYIAKKYLGTPYRWGANGPNHFDCSGFVKYVFNQYGADSKSIPRTADGMYDNSEKINKQNVRPGDLIFFDNKGNDKMDHVGIVISPYGSKKINFIHAGSSDGVAIIEDVDSNSYYSKYIGGFGRFDLGFDNPI